MAHSNQNVCSYIQECVSSRVSCICLAEDVARVAGAASRKRKADDDDGGGAVMKEEYSSGNKVGRGRGGVQYTSFDRSDYGWFGACAGPAGGLIMGGLVPAQGLLTAYPKIL